jgi:hypothetical protein
MGRAPSRLASALRSNLDVDVLTALAESCPGGWGSPGELSPRRTRAETNAGTNAESNAGTDAESNAGANAEAKSWATPSTWRWAVLT